MTTRRRGDEETMIMHKAICEQLAALFVSAVMQVIVVVVATLFWTIANLLVLAREHWF